MCQDQNKSYRARAGKTFFATQAPIYFIICVKEFQDSSYAKSMPFSKHKSRDALRAGLVAIKSCQGVSERRSPEQGIRGLLASKDPSTYTIVANANENAIDQKIFRTNLAQNIGKNTTVRNNRPRLTSSRIAKRSEDGPKLQLKLL